MIPEIIETERLVLRPWRANDRAAYVELATDPRVAEWLGATPDTAAAERAFERLCSPETGHWRWSVVRKADDSVTGAISLDRVEDISHLTGAIEIGWRLAYAAWGAGYASEGAAAVLAWGFANLGLAEIVSFTAASNARSEAVMRRVGLVRDPARDFLHPRLPLDHPLRPHIVYAARRSPQ